MQERIFGFLQQELIDMHLSSKDAVFLYCLYELFFVYNELDDLPYIDNEPLLHINIEYFNKSFPILQLTADTLNEHLYKLSGRFLDKFTIEQTPMVLKKQFYPIYDYVEIEKNNSTFIGVYLNNGLTMFRNKTITSWESETGFDFIRCDF